MNSKVFLTLLIPLRTYFFVKGKNFLKQTYTVKRPPGFSLLGILLYNEVDHKSANRKQPPAFST